MQVSTIYLFKKLIPEVQIFKIKSWQFTFYQNCWVGNWNI